MNPATLIVLLDAAIALTTKLAAAIASQSETPEELKAHLEDLTKRLEATSDAVAAYRPLD